MARLPIGLTEATFWILLSISAGLAEELAFRGYLQRTIGIIGQTIVFGLAHGYQGVYSIVRITLYGLIFGLVAHWRKSVVAGSQQVYRPALYLCGEPAEAGGVAARNVHIDAYS
jgi:membrane protease YdiL (CAAX protease family)